METLLDVAGPIVAFLVGLMTGVLIQAPDRTPPP